ncbi:hypothetical protein M3Y97_00712300 [Aphelenchoides bicaudatus]|nr:hypothetical protein M3Y97_00712300 [Aphelenchoides bicaudatus]
MEEKTNYCKLLITSVTKFFIWVGLIVNLIFLIVYVPIELYNEKQELNLVFTFGILFFDILGIFFTLMLLWSTYNNSIAAVCLSLVFAVFYVFLFVIPIVGTYKCRCLRIGESRESSSRKIQSSLLVAYFNFGSHFDCSAILFHRYS